MALFIEMSNGTTMEWHISEPIPRMIGRVVKFQADGNELTMICNAMQAKLIVVDDKEFNRLKRQATDLDALRDMIVELYKRAL